MDKNVEYYNENAESFYNNTVNADMSFWRDKFEAYVTDGGRILDVGCGSGRDSKAFKQHGFSIVAIDASREMCRMASELLGEEVWQMRFDEIAFNDEYDGIWACASLLHVSENELPSIMKRLHKALKENGKMYVSFKYGSGTRQRGERTFTDFEEESLREFISQEGFCVLESGVSRDIRCGRDDERWVNIIAIKNMMKEV